MMKYFQIIPKTNIDFIGLRKVFFIFSAVLIILSAIAVFTKGLNYGIDFTGGTVVQVQFAGPVGIEDIRTSLSAQGLKADIQTFVGRNAYAIKIKGSQDNVNEISGKIQEGLKTTNGSFDIEQTDFVGPTVGNHLAKRAIFAFLLAMGAMIIYIGFRFQNIIWGAMAVVALFHDVFVTIGVFSWLQLEVDLVIVAAFLTIAGFSVNDSIVIFDRVRENIKLNPKWTLREYLNVSVNETLSRTIITSFTVIAATSILYFMGGTVLNNFSLAMLVGLTCGAYTTILLVPGLVYQWTKNGNYSVEGTNNASVAVEEAAPKKKSKKRHS